MNVLIVEDRGAVAYPLKDELESAGYGVLLAPNISRARHYWQNRKIDCLIVDLNMDPEGLDPSQIVETMGGVLTGWVWLRDDVYSVCESMRERTVILSGYLEDLRSAVEPTDLAGIRLVPKRSHDLVQQDIMGLVSEIARRTSHKDSYRPPAP
jgi:CheY-like chemotaxis protein